MTKLPKRILARQHEITADYLRELDAHLLDITEGRSDRMFEIRDLAAILHIHPTHLTNTIKLTTGNHPCFYFEQKIVAVAKGLIEANEMPITAIAGLLTYDPSNFTKFFKHFTGQTPTQYREEFFRQKTEILTN
ncbi:helix-turn-helix domain-containing protein [Flavobacterium psychrotrophum]|uniref:helix-turn-helix domain-containing protein n=1 Tax=Flavobacterium psychrotrophum TaxID=2294119 RepID=UPI000E31C465|nr:AraC family transcriptional regulator [Flavobacterium psychrotrophum]